MSRPRRLLVALVLNLFLVGALVAVGITAHSIAVVAASVDCLADAAGISAALVAFPLSRRFPRAHSIAAIVNGGWLFALSVLVVAAASWRLVEGAPPVQGLPVVIASSVAMVLMLGAALVLNADLDDPPDDEQEILSVRATVLDTFSDAASAGGVALSGGIILLTHSLNWLDPAVGIVIAVVVAYHAFRLLTDVRVTLRG